MPEVSDTKYVTTATWDDVPHLNDDAKKQLWDSIPVYQRDARSKGIPQLGSGAIYPILEDKITCDPFEIPFYWPLAYALDVGWNRTAALWGAYDRQSDIVYFYSEHYESEAEPETHVRSIKARGKWIPGVIDPAARNRSQRDGDKLYDEYVALGLKLGKAQNAVEAGLFMVWQRMLGGRLKIFKTLSNTLSEYRLYRRDEHGKIVKTDDHLMDCMRYWVVSAIGLAETKANDTDFSLAEARAELQRMSADIF